MKRIILGLFTITLAVTVVVGATLAIFTDQETSEGNTFTAGTLDLEVDVGNDPLGVKFESSGMVPGNTYSGGCVELHNNGAVDGLLSVEVSNFVSNENSLLDPETSDGDSASTEVDPSGYDNNTGDGELWDQMTSKFCLDNGAGGHTGNATCDWDDTIIHSTFGTPSNDYSSYYSLPEATDIAADNSYVLTAGGYVDFCTEVKFVDDTTNEWWGAQSGLTNNMAMSDDAQFDITFGLSQTP